jgi:hypothetical protein
LKQTSHSKKNDFIYKFDLFQGNIYEEISTNDEVPSAPPVYERQPFIGHEFTNSGSKFEWLLFLEGFNGNVRQSL